MVMKMLNRWLYVFCSSAFAAIFFISCMDPSLREAGAFAAQIMGAKDFEVVKKDAFSGSVYELTADDAAWNLKYSQSDVMSVGALAFFNQINDNSPKWYVRLVVKTQQGVYRQTYGSDELKQADRCIDKVSSFFKWKPQVGMDSLRPLVDPVFFPDSLLLKIAESVKQQESLDNSFMRSELVGFESDTVAGIPVLTVKMNAIRKQNRQRYDAFVELKNERLLLVVPAE
jgi:hypothetical protein